MAKRFTDSEKWNNVWFQDLPSKFKLLWLYLLDSCDHAGVWRVNFKTVHFFVGEHFEVSEVKRVFKERVDFLDDERWFIKKFIDFQYNGLKSDQVGKSVSKKLQDAGIQYVKPLGSPLAGAIDKDKDKVIVKDKVKIDEKEQNFSLKKGEPFIRVNTLPPVIIQDLHNHLSSTKEMAYESYRMHNKAGDYEKICNDFVLDRIGSDFNDEKHLWNAFTKFCDLKKASLSKTVVSKITPY